MSKPESSIADEKDAILSLLRFSEQAKTNREDADPRREDRRDAANGPSRDVPSNQVSPRDIGPRNISPPPHAEERPEQVFVKDMGRKRKNHPTVDGQFEDAPEIYLPLAERRLRSEAYIPPSFTAGFPPHLAAAASATYIPPPTTTTPGPPSIDPNMPFEQRLHLETLLREAMALQQNPFAPIHDGRPAAAAAMQMQLLATKGMWQQQQQQQQKKADREGASGEQVKEGEDIECSPPSYRYRKSIELVAMQPPPEQPTDKEEEEEKRRRLLSTKLRYEEYTPPTSWGELTDVPRMPYTSADDDMTDPIEVIGPNDVLLGRGGLTNTNPGNIKFRALVARYRMAYCTAPKGDKGALSRFLCNFVRASEGRFLRRDEKSRSWFEVGDEKAVMKCGQALREGTAEIIRKVVNDGARAVHQIDPDGLQDDVVI